LFTSNPNLAIFERGNNIEPMPVKPKNPSKSMFAEKEKMQLLKLLF